MAAADALERIIENDSESRFAKFLHKVDGVVNWKAFLGDQNDGRSIGVHGGREGNLVSNDVNGVGNLDGNVGSSKGVGEELGGNPGGNVGSSKGVGEELGGNPGGNVGSSKGVGEELGGNPGGNVGSSKGVAEELGGNCGGNVGSTKGVGKELGGNPGGNVGSTKGVGEERGRGHRGGGYGGRESFEGAVGVGGNRYVGWEPASHALSHGNRGLHSRYGHQLQGSLAPYNAGETQFVRTHHVLHTQYVQTQHVLHTPWISTVGGPVQGRTPYSIYDMAPQSTGVSSGMRQTAPHAYNHQFINYAPSPINYGAYGAYVVNTAIPVEEMAPGTSNSTHSALVAQYGVMQPQQYVPGYSLQGATQHHQ
ncbi:hypothetical protein M758_8G002600, partial [Ceratodon purpureus]